MPAGHRTLSRTALTDRVRASEPGEWITYHIGFLWWDRERGEDFQKVHSTASAAWELMEAGKVRLMQRLILPGVCEYRVQKLPEPFKKVEWEGCYHKDWIKL